MNRTGAASLPELIMVSWLFGFVLAGVATFASAQGRLSASQHQRGRARELARTATVVLRQELRHSLPAQILAAGGDSIRLRAVRGVGGLCGVDGRDLLVRYRGARRPEPDKDSVLIVTASAVEAAGGIVSAVGAPDCGDGLRIRLQSAPVSDGGLVVVYEPGTYLIAAGALRYRRGSAGRQPLTEALLQEASSLHAGAAGVSLGLYFRPDSLPRAGPVSRRHTISILNRGRAP